MQRTIVRPDRLDLDSPGRRDYWVALEHDSIWGDHLLPLTVLVGPDARPGRGLVAFGSNHGNEYEGPMAIKHLMSEIALADVLGRILLVPVLNPSAFHAGTRESADDGVNLNRAFVEAAGRTPALGGITHRIVAFVREHIWPRVHVVLDLHSGGDVARFALCTSFHPLDDPEQGRQTEETARAFGTPLIILYQNQTPGLLPSEAERLGKITVGTELGWGRAVQAEGVRCGRRGVLAAAIRHGQLRGDLGALKHDRPQVKAAMVDRDCFTVAPFAGHYEALVECGQRVRKGDTVGLLHDFDHIDAPAWPAVAGVEGVVIAQAWVAPVQRGQHIVVTGRVVD
jgi:N-alpha-acetyl-L-2,4-diaminobutyrate deacetylase